MSFHWLVGDIIKEDAAFATVPSRERPRRSVADTELEAMLDLHRTWVESHGKSGMRLELAHADFEGMDLTGANLQGAVLNGANLQGSELLLADLRGASLVQANLQEANLLGADLRGANLEGATLVGSAGLHTTQLAGASLLWSMLPSSIAEFEGQNLAQARARHCYHVLLATLAICALCCLRIFTARDVQFLNDAPLLRVLPSSGVIPIATFFVVMPIVLFGLFVYLHIALQRLWEQLGELPSIFPDGHSLDRTGPWILMTLFQARFRGWRANWVAPSALQMIAPFALAYWAIPATLFLFWARYLVMQDIRGALLQILLLMLSVGIAMQLPRVRDEGVPEATPARSVETIEEPIRKSEETGGVRAEDQSAGDSSREHSSLRDSSLDDSSLDDSESEPDFVALAEPIENHEFRGEAPPAPVIVPEIKKPRRAQAAMERLVFAAALGVFLVILTLGVDYGVPHDSSVMPDVSQASLLRWSADAFWTLGYRPYANLTEASISTVPKDWSWRDDDLSVVKGAQLNDLRLRYAEAYRTIWINAHLWKADLRGAYFSESDFRGANLREANLHATFFDRVRFFRANLHGADLEMANLTRADMRETDLSYAKLGNAILVDAHLGNANLFGADLHSAQLAHASIESADLRDANLANADLKLASLQDAYLWSAKLPGADLKDAELKGAILIEASLRNSNLEGADLQGAVLRGTDFSGANIAGADLRGATGLTAAQICSAKNRAGAQYDDSLAPLVEAQCGATATSGGSATAPSTPATAASTNQPK